MSHHRLPSPYQEEAISFGWANVRVVCNMVEFEVKAWVEMYSQECDKEYGFEVRCQRTVA